MIGHVIVDIVFNIFYHHTGNGQTSTTVDFFLKNLKLNCLNFAIQQSYRQAMDTSFGKEAKGQAYQ